VESFVYPISPAPRTAVLVPWFAKDKFGRVGFKKNRTGHRSVRIFPDGWRGDTAAFEPQAVAGTYEQVRLLDRRTAPSLTHAIVVLARPGSPRLTEEDRDRLWRIFRLPVFEQIIGKSGELLAAECEAHDGMHVESTRLPIEHEYVDASPCPCGRKTPRIGGVQGTAILRRVAAYAR
jgi:hypothetical protein